MAGLGGGMEIRDEEGKGAEDEGEERERGCG